MATTETTIAPVNHGKRAIATLPSGQQVIRDFPAGTAPHGFGWRLSWAKPSLGFRDGWSRDEGTAFKALAAKFAEMSRCGCSGFSYECAHMVDTGRPAGDLADFLAQKG